MKTTRYMIAHRFKHQSNRKWKNITDADFHYSWAYPMSHDIFALKRPKFSQDSFDTLEQARAEVKGYTDEYKYGYRIYKVEFIEEHTQDIAYQPMDELEYNPA